MPVFSRDQHIDALKKSQELLIEVQTIVSEQVKDITVKILANLHMCNELSHCKEGHPTVYFFGKECPACAGKIQFTEKYDKADLPIITGKIVETVKVIPEAVQFKDKVLEECAEVLQLMRDRLTTCPTCNASESAHLTGSDECNNDCQLNNLFTKIDQALGR